VAEVARVLHGHRQRERVAPRPRRHLAQQLADVPDFRRKRGGPVVLEQPAELLEVRAAAGRVDDDEVDVLECPKELPRERLALVEAAGVDRERTAAALRGRHDFEPVSGEDAGGRAVHVGEDRRLDAAGEQPDAAALRADRGRHVGHAAACAPRRRHGDERAKAPGHRQHASERREPEGGPHAPWVGQSAKEESAQEPVGGRAAVLLLDGVAGRLDQPVVADA
jgi:hypothetical protein